MEIWERDPRAKIGILEEEVSRRNAGLSLEEETPDVTLSNDGPQSLLPKIWGSGWKPELPLKFPYRVPADDVRNELLGFLSLIHI